MNRYYIALNTDMGIYYYVSLENEVINLTYSIGKSTKFYTKSEAKKIANSIGGYVKREVII